MEKCLYHQSQNSIPNLITSFPYDYNHWEFNSAHFHKNYEILVAVRGSFDCFIDQTHFELSEGDAVLFQPFQVHGLHVHDGSLVWCSTFSERFFKGIAGTLQGKRAKNPVFRPDPVVTRFYLDRVEHYIGKRREITVNEITQIQENVFKSCAYAMGSAFLEQAELEPLPKKADSLAVNIVWYIDENFKSNITLDTISKHLGYNYQHLSKVFNQTFGMSFKQMLNRYRLEYAISLLGESDMSIADIAFESGFQSMRSFDFTCRDIYGKSPKDIRKELKAIG